MRGKLLGKLAVPLGARQRVECRRPVGLLAVIAAAALLCVACSILLFGDLRVPANQVGAHDRRPVSVAEQISPPLTGTVAPRPAGSRSPAAADSNTSHPYVPGRLILGVNPGVSAATVTALIKPYGARIESQLPQLHQYTITFAKRESAPRIAASLSRNAELRYSEPDFIARSQTTIPNDPYYASTGSWGQLYRDMWGLQKIDAGHAWDIQRGATSTVVAVVDTGLDASHPDMSSNVWHNTSEVAGNVIDDDQNGYVDDVSGWNFVSGTANANDDNGHGTHVAGTIAAQTGNGLGISGIAGRSKIMPVKVLDASGLGAYSEGIAGIVYATDNGARVINLSWGGTTFSQSLQDAVNYAYSKGVLVVAAAGNSASDASGFYPAACAHVLCVSATDSQDKLASFSNYGPRIDVAAPGVDILSLQATGTALGPVVSPGYVRLNGTSMAAPHVAGLATLLVSQSPTLSVDDLCSDIEAGVDDLGAPGKDSSFGWGRINAYKSLSLVASASPSDIRGAVRDEFGFSLPGIAVVAYHGDGRGGWSLIGTASTDGAGSYDVHGLAGGRNYAVRFTDPGGHYNDQYYCRRSTLPSADLVWTRPGSAASGIDATLAATTVTPIALTSATVSGIAVDYVYTGSPICPVPVVAIGQETLVQGVDYTVSYTNNTDLGVATVTITGAGRFVGATERTFAITPASLASAVLTGIQPSYPYTGSPIEPAPIVSFGQVTLVKGVDYTVTYANNVTPGTGTLDVTGIGGHTGALETTFAITARALPVGSRFCASGVAYQVLSPTTVRVGMAAVSSTTTTVTIPAVVADSSGTTYSVVAVGKEAFSYCPSLTVVTLPSSVTSIGEAAFCGSSLTSIAIPSSVASVGPYAFKDCTSLTSIAMPDSVTTIGSDMLCGCWALTSVRISGSLTSIPNRTFNDCYSLTSVTVPASVTVIGSQAFQYCVSLTSVTIPDSVTSIQDAAFFECNSLSSLTIPESVTSIGDSAFYDCYLLTSLTLPDSVSTIGDSAFQGCASLSDLTLDSHLVAIGANTFSGTPISTIVLPDSVRSMGAGVFSGCAYLATATVSASLTAIPADTFQNCYSLASVTIPDSVVSIQEGAFQGSGMVSLTIPNSVTSIGGSAFAVSALTSITIPPSVTTIGESAFAGSALTSITIPTSVTAISEWTFNSCQSLTSVTIPDSVTNIGEGAFYGCTSLALRPLPESVAFVGDSAFDSGPTWLIASATVSGVPASHTYTGAEIQPVPTTVVLSGKIVRDGLLLSGPTTLSPDSDYTVSYSANKNAGTATVILTGAGTFGGSAEATFAILPASLASATVSGIAPLYSYTGAPIAPSPVVTVDGLALTEDVDYAVSYSANTNPGVANMTITGTGNSIGTIDETFTIIPAVLPVGSTFTTEGVAYRVLTGANVQVGDGSSAAVSAETTSLVAPASVQAGDGTRYNVTAVGDYAFAVRSALASLTLPAAVTSVGYCAFYNDASLVSPGIPASLSSIGSYAFYGCSSLALAPLPGSVVSVGAHAFDMGPRWSIASAMVSGIATSYAYNGAAIQPAPTVALSGKNVIGGVLGAGRTLAAGTDYTASYSPDIAPGTVTITMAGTGSYTGALVATYAITPATLPVGTTFSTGGVTYKVLSASTVQVGTGSSPAVAAPTTSAVLPASVKDGSGTNYAVTTIGAYAFSGCSSLASVTVPGSVTSIGAYAFYGCRSLVLGPLPATVASVGTGAFDNGPKWSITSAAVTGLTATYVYTGGAIQPMPKLVLNGKTVIGGTISTARTLAAGTDFTAAYSDSTTCGVATVAITGKGAYAGSIARTFTIVPYVSNVTASSAMYHTKSYSVYGFLKPGAAAGSYPVLIYKYRMVSGKWKSYGTASAKAYNYSTYTKYLVSLKLAYTGTWRLRAYAPASAGRAASWSSGYKTVTVK